jgi:DNA gyrase subunit A
MVITDNGKILRVPVSGFSVIGRNTQGVRLITTEDKEKVVAVARLAEKEEDELEEDELNERVEGADETGEEVV